MSDSVGETGDLAVKAVVSQFRPHFEQVEIRRFPHIHGVDHLQQIISIAQKQDAIIVYTLVEKSCAQHCMA